ncbi:MAG: hypothetical protein GWN87_33655, partial [Desulfuromonadales bacterium]|nr:hypothetical protein [Desulfuromonadales bacterium]NIS44392.1 hypothetical protein [Desulfuromonadales bacterium]
MKNKRFNWLHPIVLIVCLLTLPAAAAAELTLVDAEDFQAGLGLEFGAGLFTSDDSNF